MKKGLTEIIFILDRSGSMVDKRADTEGGFNSFIDEQKRVAGECRVSLYQFDDHYEPVYENRPVAEVPKLTLVPRGNTALLDAIGRTVVAVGTRLAKLAESERPEKVLIVTMTDGYENASQEFTFEKVKELVEHQQSKYNWAFVFMGADMDAIGVASQLGYTVANTMSYGGQRTQSSLRALSSTTTDYRAGNVGAQSLNVQDAYEAELEDEKKPVS